jgi:hypothetical protein
MLRTRSAVAVSRRTEAATLSLIATARECTGSSIGLGWTIESGLLSRIVSRDVRG